MYDETDIFAELINGISDWLRYDGQDEFLLCLRIIVILLAILFGLSNLYQNGSRNVSIFWFCGLLCAIASMFIPLELALWLPLFIQSLLFLAMIISLIFLPGFVAFYLSPYPGIQRRIRWGITGLILFLFLIR